MKFQGPDQSCIYKTMGHIKRSKEATHTRIVYVYDICNKSIASKVELIKDLIF